MLEPVDRPRDRGRRSQLRLENDDVPCRRRAASELVENRRERLARIRAPRALRRNVARTSERVADLLQAELADVARDGRLSHPTPLAGERVEQLELRRDPLPGDEARDQPLALGLPEVASLLHSVRLVIQVLHPRATETSGACCGS